MADTLHGREHETRAPPEIDGVFRDYGHDPAGESHEAEDAGGGLGEGLMGEEGGESNEIEVEEGGWE